MFNNILDVTIPRTLDDRQVLEWTRSWWHSRAANKPDWKVRGIWTGFEYLSGQPPRVGRVYWQRIGVCASAKWNRRCRSSSFTQQKQHTAASQFTLPEISTLISICPAPSTPSRPIPGPLSFTRLRDRFLNSASKSIESKILNSTFIGEEVRKISRIKEI